MRMPVDHDGKLLETEAIELIRYAIDSGINYVDTAYGYHHGESEMVVGKALLDGYRERVILTTKLPGWLAETESDLDRLLNEQLAKLQTDHVDIYLLHSQYDTLWEKLKEINILAFLDRIKADGRAKHVGFSFHDELPVFLDILGSYDWDVCQVQYNILDVNYQAGLAGIEAAAAAGVDVIVMEPLRGGALADKIPDDIMELWAESERAYSPVEWAFRFVADQPQVKTILSGMHNEAQVADNVRIFSALTEPLTAEDKAHIERVQKRYREKIQIGCTSCEYCLPCPEGVQIPRIFKLWNNVYLFDDLVASQDAYDALIKEGGDQSHCVACGLCEAACPQHLSIIEDLIHADRMLRR